MVTGSYGYDNAGDLNSITYSDGTPGVTYSRNILGQVYQIDDAAGSRTIVYNADGQPETESYTSGTFAGLTLKTDYQTGLRSGFSVLQGTTPLVAQSIGYDNFGRLATFAQGAVSGTYGYKAGRDLVETLDHQQSGQSVFTTQKSYDGIDRLTGIAETPGVNIGAYSYGYNGANQRNRVDLSDGSFWQYGYDGLGQLTSGSRRWSATEAVSGQQYGYAFDGIGNRLTTTVNGWQSTYALATPAGLNQYASRTVPGVVDLVGKANADTIVSVTGSNPAVMGSGTVNRAVRHGEYWHVPLKVDNTGGPVQEAVDVMALKPNIAPGQDGVMHQTGSLLVAKTPEQYVYDLDGNLTQDSLWKYTWDGENRLVGVESVTPDVPVAARKKLVFGYDGGCRRISKKVYLWDAQANAYATTPATESHFLYDGWNLVAELDASNNVTRSYLWGLDLSGSPQGAGGVGGLIAITTTGANSGTYFTAFDGNGNVTDLMNSADGNSVAQYEYGPFGEPVRVSGIMAGVNPFRFSTKYTDDEDGVVCYLHRYYRNSTGRWLSRDPIEERGGFNLYVFTLNSPLNFLDILGFKNYRIGSPKEPPMTFDEDFVYDSNAHATVGDYRSWIWWNMRGAGAEMFRSDLQDAVEAYRHYLDGTGTDLEINYSKAYRDDMLIRNGVDIEIRAAQRDAERLASSNGPRFTMTGAAERLESPSTENWQKTIGQHYIWGHANVEVCGDSFTMTITIHEKDRYNFNRGKHDIATRLPDDSNGRFAVLGWAKSFITNGKFEKKITWKKGETGPTKDVGGSRR